MMLSAVSKSASVHSTFSGTLPVSMQRRADRIMEMRSSAHERRWVLAL